jgi:endonuclease IV
MYESTNIFFQLKVIGKRDFQDIGTLKKLRRQKEIIGVILPICHSWGFGTQIESE